jgi:ribosome recycling factor
LEGADTAVQLQTLTDSYVAKTADLLKQKEKEILS